MDFGCKLLELKKKKTTISTSISSASKGSPVISCYYNPSAH